MKKIALLGCTGSIGLKSLKIIESNPGKYKVVALAAGRNIELLIKQINKFHPAAVAVSGENLAVTLRERIKNISGIKVYSGTGGFIHLATLEEVDTVISAITGAAGLPPTYAAIKAGKVIALANKETMVMAGALIMEEAKTTGVPILPIDSEHSAIFQSLQGHPREDLKRIILTASGGPFKNLPLEKMRKVTPAQALKHPSWEMGRKISIDSATLMNKGLEAIEAKWFFDLKMEQVSILIHPQSIVHSMVEYRDGSVIAQMGIPDMTIPISYALSYPRHIETHLPPLKLDEVGVLNFEKPNTDTFKCLELAFRASEIGGSMPAVMNGANEIAVDSFLSGKIGFLQLPVLIEKTMEVHNTFPVNDLDSVMEADRWARKTAKEALRELLS